MLRVFKITEGVIQEIDCDPAPSPSQLSDAQWIDLNQPTKEERSLLQNLLHTNLPDSDDVDEIGTSTRCFVDQAGIHVYSLFLTQIDDRHITVSVASILQKERLITLRESDLADFQLLLVRAQRGQFSATSPEDLLITLLEQKVENHADTLEDLHRQLESVSQLVLEESDSDLEDFISKLARLEDSNGKIRLCLMDTERDISFLLRHLRHQPEQSESLREIMRDIETLTSQTMFLFDKVNFLMNSTQGFINIKQNQIIKIFSIAAVVFLPPTLVASIYGMNFHYMPELKWSLGYPWAIGLMILSGIAPYWFFKRKGWL